MNLREVLNALRATWWLPLIGLVIGGGLAVAYSLLQTPLYTSSTQMFVSTAVATSSADAFQGSQFSQQRAASYAQLVSSDQIARRVAERLDLNIPPAQLQGMTTAAVIPGTVLIDVVVTDTRPERAQRIAEAVGREFTDFITELEAPSPGGAPLIRVTITEAPEVPSTPSSPDVARNLALGVFAGGLVGAGLALARARMDRSVKDPEEAAELAGAPVIGVVLKSDALNDRHMFIGGSDSRMAEEYRQLRTNLQFLNIDKPPKVIMLTSALASEGKTTAVVNLGLALAEAGRRVLIVEADLRRPRVTGFLSMVSGVGLTNILTGAADLDDVIQPYGDGTLSVIGSGPLAPNPGELLASSHMAELVAKLRAHSDYVLFDAPPLLPVADSSGLAVHMDGVVLSVRYGSTRKEELRSAAAALERVGATMLGLVLNIVPSSADVASALASGYQYTHQPRRAAAKRMTLGRNRGRQRRHGAPVAGSTRSPVD